MDFNTTIKLFAGNTIKESNMDKETKIQLLNQVKESDVFEVMTLLIDGTFEPVSEQAKPVVFERFKNSEIPGKLKYFVKEQKETKIDKDDVKQAAMKTAKKIFKEPDEKIIDDMVKKAIKKGKDTEDAIQIVINMMRSED